MIKSSLDESILAGLSRISFEQCAMFHVWATLKQKHETRLEMSIFLYDATHNKSLSFKKNTELHITPC